EMKKAGAQLRLNAKVQYIEKSSDGFTLQLASGEVLTCSALVVATGGKSIPKMGATDFGYRLAGQFGVRVTDTRAALVPLTFGGELLEQLSALSGVAVPARVRCGKTGFEEALLFTHRGLSGPAILQISSYWREGQEIGVDMAPGLDLFAALKQAKAERPRQAVQTLLAEHLPRRLAQLIAEQHEASGNLADQPDKRLRAIATAVNGWQVKPV